MFNTIVHVVCYNRHRNFDKSKEVCGATANLKRVLLRKRSEWQENRSRLEECLSFFERMTKEGLEETPFHQWLIAKKCSERKLENYNSSGIPVSERWAEVFNDMKTNCVLHSDDPRPRTGSVFTRSGCSNGVSVFNYELNVD